MELSFLDKFSISLTHVKPTYKHLSFVEPFVKLIMSWINAPLCTSVIDEGLLRRISHIALINWFSSLVLPQRLTQENSCHNSCKQCPLLKLTKCNTFSSMFRPLVPILGKKAPNKTFCLK